MKEDHPRMAQQVDQPIAGLIRDLKARGIGVLITDHNVRETLDIVDRACIIYGGQVLFAGSPQELVADENVRRLYLGESFTL
jgi:lipopolysaccharide export system ATP-binding protein